MNYKYTMPLFDKEDQEEALDYLVKRVEDNKKSLNSLLKSDCIKIIKTDEDNEAEEIDFDQLPKDLINEFAAQIYSAAFGKNIVLMANYYKVQDDFFDKFETNILEYLDLSKNIKDANIIYVTPNEIFVKYLINKAMTDKSFQPVSYWNPNSDWDWHILHNSRKRKKDDYMNPLNNLRSVILNIKGKISDYFLSYLDNYGVEISDYKSKPDDDNDRSVSIQLLPFPSYNNLLTVIQGIHKYF